LKVPDEKDAFESAVARLPYPVFIVGEGSRLRAINDAARTIWNEQALHESQTERFPAHPLSLVIRSIQSAPQESHEVDVLQLGAVRYEVISSYPSTKGSRRWLMLMLRPLDGEAKIDHASIRKRWSLTPRETEIAAACIAGRTSAEICSALSISRETFKTHMKRILNKAECETRSQMMTRYFFGNTPE
jgi:DNA-binding CsgD family transcriptional regulator